MQKVLRSMILEQFPLDLRVQIELLSRKRGIENKKKQEELFKLLRDANISNIAPLGSGTNRYAFKMNGFVVKVATDNDGKIDNLKEMKMAKRLFPDVTKVYEVSENGTLLVSEYIQPFQSFGEMQRYADQIKEILKKISQVYLIGDVGLDSKNYANWGLRIGSDRPVCLDFAYIYDAKSDLFICGECNTGSVLIPNSDYTQLICPNPLCGHKYNFEDIRGRMSNEAHAQEIGDLSEESYRLSESKVLTELTPDRSNYLKRVKIVTKEEKPKEEPIEFDNFIFNKEEEKMIVKATAVLANGMNIYPAKKTEDEVAFSGEITSEPTIIQATVVSTPQEEIIEEPAVEEFPEVTAEEIVEGEPEEIVIEGTTEVPAPIEEVTAEPVEEPVDEQWHPSEVFKAEINNALKKLARKIQNSLYRMELWDEIRTQYMPAKAKPRPNGQFYDNVQTAVFQSLSKFLKLQPKQMEDGSREWFCTEFEGTPYEPTLIFLERWYSDSYIMNADGKKSIDKYRNVYDDYLGLQNDWIPEFKKKLSSMIKEMDLDGVNIVAKTIEDIWCVPKLVIDEKIEAAAKKLEDQGLVKNDDGNLTLTTKGEEVVEKSGTLVSAAPAGSFESESEMLAFSESLITNTSDKTQPDLSYLTSEEDETSDEEEDEEDMNDTEVLIYPDTKVDIIRLKFSDTFGNIEIPFYKKLSDINPDEMIPSMADERNGDWDWLIHIVPDLRFLTEKPDEWLGLNNDEDHDDTVKFVVLDPDHNGKTLMGMYAINGIFTVDENGVSHVESSPAVMKQLNILFNSEIGTTAISHYARNISEDELIRDEDYAKEILNGYLPEDEEEEAEEPIEGIIEGEPEDDVDDSEELGILEPIPRRYN